MSMSPSSVALTGHRMQNLPDFVIMEIVGDATMVHHTEGCER